MKRVALFLTFLAMLSGAGICWFLFRSIRSHGGAADNARNELDSATAGQRETASTLDRVANGADASADTAQSVTSRVSDALDSIDTAQRDIDESARILREIRTGARADGGAAADAENSVSDRER